MEFPLMEACLPVYSFVDIDLITTCVLDLFPTKLLMSHLSYILDIILCIVESMFFQPWVYESILIMK